MQTSTYLSAHAAVDRAARIRPSLRTRALSGMAADGFRTLDLGYGRYLVRSSELPDHGLICADDDYGRRVVVTILTEHMLESSGIRDGFRDYMGLIRAIDQMLGGGP